MRAKTFVTTLAFILRVIAASLFQYFDFCYFSLHI